MAITKVRASSINLTTDTTFVDMAKGTTAQRPGGGATATIEYLLVGGGGGGSGWGAGGGAGGVLTGSFQINSFDTLNLSIGSGGTPGGYDSSLGYFEGGDGGDTTLIFSGNPTLTALGGGHGGGYNSSNVGTNGGDGGSGGGGGGGSQSANGSPGSGLIGQGKNGGSAATGVTGSYGYPGPGGGGGAGAVGGNGSGMVGGNGGDGIQSSITGVATYYGGGGAGQSPSTTNVATGGQGGGGNGARYWDASLVFSEIAATSGIDGLGGGGGGASYPSAAGTGGSGVIILKVPTGNQLGLSSGATPTLNPDGTVANYTIYKFTSNANVVFTSNIDDGLIRFNTSTSKFEYYNNGWKQVVFI